jgi:poly(hydroxyalkanoate) granule-associated protein
MVTRKRKTTAKKTALPLADNQLAQAVTQSAQKIWLAGLGAFARARTEGDKFFDLLVEQGKGIRAKTEKATDAALRTVRSQADNTLANAQGQWDKLEQVFEDRVSRSLNRLGVLSSKDVEDLARQVAELNQSVRDLMGGTAPRAARKAPAKKKAAGKRKAAAK